MREELEKKLARFLELEKMMSDPAVVGDSAKIADIAREHGALAKVTGKYQTFKKLGAELAELREMAASDDPEAREMAEAEIEEVKAKREALFNDLLGEMIGGEDAQRSRCVMEIRAGTGGDEAALFAGDLYRMYRKHAEDRGWKFEVLDANPTDLGGFKEVIIGFEGEGCFRELQYESGGHRVQRVPETEAKGRVHTSAATVAVLPEPEDVEVDLKPEDYEVERYAASAGPGGQHVNKTASAVRLYHKDGITVQCSDERSQHKNLARALRLLKSRLYEKKREEEAKKRADHRKSLVGSGDRSQRIRTYNFPQNRVSDHRINLDVYHLDQILAGQMQQISQPLLEHDRRQLREDMGDLD